jgi:hypothetical protein
MKARGNNFKFYQIPTLFGNMLKSEKFYENPNKMSYFVTSGPSRTCCTRFAQRFVWGGGNTHHEPNFAYHVTEGPKCVNLRFLLIGTSGRMSQSNS